MTPRLLAACLLTAWTSAVATIAVFGKQDSPSDVDALVEQLHEDSVERRISAARALGELGPAAAPAIDRLIELLAERERGDKGIPSWVNYSQALGKIGDEAIEELIVALDSDDLQVFKGVCDSLQRMGSESLPAFTKLHELLREGDQERVWAIMYVMESWGSESRDACDTIRSFLSNDDFQVQIMACRTLAAIGPPARPAVNELLGLLETGNVSVKGHAALTLGAIGPVEDVDTVTPLIAMFTHFSDSIRDRALTGAGRLGEHAAAAAPQLKRLIKDGNYRNRSRAAWALWRVSGETEATIECLIELTDNPATNLEAIQRMGDMGNDGAGAVDHLIHLVTNGDSDEKFEAATSLGRIGMPAAKALPELKELLDSEDELLLRAVKTAIEKIENASGR